MTPVRPAYRLKKALAIKGWMSEQELRWLADQARVAQAVIEIGSCCGRSTRALADHCPGTVFAIDPWVGYCNDDGSQAQWIEQAAGGGWTGIRAAFDRNLADHLASGLVKAIARRSEVAAGLFEPGMVDLVFIDGDHRYEVCASDIAQYRPLIRSGGILAGHDYTHADWPGVKRAVDELVGPVTLCGSIWWVRV